MAFKMKGFTPFTKDGEYTPQSKGDHPEYKPQSTKNKHSHTSLLETVERYEGIGDTKNPKYIRAKNLLEKGYGGYWNEKYKESKESKE